MRDVFQYSGGTIDNYKDSMFGNDLKHGMCVEGPLPQMYCRCHKVMLRLHEEGLRQGVFAEDYHLLDIVLSPFFHKRKIKNMDHIERC